MTQSTITAEIDTFDYKQQHRLLTLGSATFPCQRTLSMIIKPPVLTCVKNNIDMSWTYKGTARYNNNNELVLSKQKRLEKKS
jgi:hypothetical protein